MYTIKLTNYAFDNTYTNARLFESKAERDLYFENLQGFTFNKQVNFIARDIIATEIDIKVEPHVPLFTLLNYNYAIIKNENETLYFYIRKSEQLSAGLIRCRLENDIIQNYIYDVEFSNCLIKKAHLDRFIDNGDGTVKFNGNVNSKLFEREEIKNLSKRLVHREKLIFKIDTTENSLFNKWLSENVAGWLYVCCSKLNDGYNFYGSSGEQKIDLQYTRLSDLNTYSSLPSYTHCTLCFPIFKKSSAILAQSDDGTFYSSISSESFTEFINNNNGYSNIYSIKISPKPPFLISDYSNKYTITQGTYNYLILKLNNNDIRQDKVGYTFNGLRAFNTSFISSSNTANSLFYIADQDINGVELYLENDSILPKLTFNKNDIINSNRNYLFNPKLNNSDYKECRITMVGSSESYDIQKLNDEHPKFIYKEMIGSDITKGNIKYKANNSENVFNESYNESYNGLSFTNDLSFPMVNNVYNEFLANNKNAFLSFQNTQAKERSASIIGTLGGLLGGAGNFAMSGNPVSIMNAATSGLTNLFQTVSKQAYEQTQFNLSIDDMRSAPQQMQNNNGNPAQALSISDLGVYIEIYEALPNELEIANNFAYDKGFIYNQYDNIKNNMYSRKYFNYIEANIENIKANLSNDVKFRLRQIFANGIKFWHTDEIIFDKENYERSLEANG